MIICAYKDGGSIRTYKTKSARRNAMTNLFKHKGISLFRVLASTPGHFSMKVYPRLTAHIRCGSPIGVIVYDGDVAYRLLPNPTGNYPDIVTLITDIRLDKSIDPITHL